MISGIYKLTFPDGTYYIGKSNDIERRLREHAEKFDKGTAARPMQNAFNRHGKPEAEILIRCHEDHCDLLEAMCIRANTGSGMLNTSKPKVPNEADWLTLFENMYWLELSTADHIREIKGLGSEVREYRFTISTLENDLLEAEEIYEENLRDIKSGTKLESIEKELRAAREVMRVMVAQLERLNKRNWFQRLFNL